MYFILLYRFSYRYYTADHLSGNRVFNYDNDKCLVCRIPRKYSIKVIGMSTKNREHLFEFILKKLISKKNFRSTIFAYF
jgi:hypothetical protein